MKRYVLFPGMVRSQTDGEWHYVTAGQLADLYGVDYRKCLVVHENTVGYRKQENYIELRPRYDGDYSMGGDTEFTIIFHGKFETGEWDTWELKGTLDQLKLTAQQIIEERHLVEYWSERK